MFKRKGASFSKQDKNKELYKVDKNILNGPGTYELGSTFTTKGCRFPKDKRGVLKGKNIPGPGSYNLKEFTQESRMAKSMAGRFKSDLQVA